MMGTNTRQVGFPPSVIKQTSWMTKLAWIYRYFNTKFDRAVHRMLTITGEGTRVKERLNPRNTDHKV